MYGSARRLHWMELSGAESRRCMSTREELTVHGEEAKAYGLRDIVRESHRYSEEARQKDRDEQRRAWFWFALVVALVGSLVGFYAWIAR